VLVFFLSFFVLFSSGRLDNFDPLAQLQAATALVNNGSLGVSFAPMPEDYHLWTQSGNGLYYEMHDIGGSLFMSPSAAIGSFRDHRPVDDQIREPSWVSRFLAAESYTILAAFGCLLLYRLFATVYPRRTAFLLSLAFATATIFHAYTKSAFDVMGASVGVCLLLYFCAEVLQSAEVQIRDGIRIVGAFAMASAFRYSLAPFLLISIVLFFLAIRHKNGWARLRNVSLVAGGLLFIPTLAYNWIRTGGLLRTATTGKYSPLLALQGNIWHGLYGLLLSPNRGLLVFAPVFLLLPALPFYWSRLPEPLRRLIVCFGPGAAGYILLIAKLNHWGPPTGWGPRYLLPVLPILFLPVAGGIVALWPRLKAPLIALLGLSILLNTVPTLVNYRLAASSYPGAMNPETRLPAQQAAAWQALGKGLRGEPLSAPENVANDPLLSLQRNFPDWWLVKAREAFPRLKALTALTGLFLSLLLLAALCGLLFGSQAKNDREISGERETPAQDLQNSVS
jgi:hypothetical protein